MPFSLVKMFCFSSPEPFLNNSRAINYIPNWIPICPFAMYGSKTFYLLSPFKVPQDPSVLRKYLLLSKLQLILAVNKIPTFIQFSVSLA